ncbi:hypothetical protein RZS08_65145, partial [Arthrospira platensis SPKY1]|nr:hypothetical protein [Arthrospira platensis SPKY1]
RILCRNCHLPSYQHAMSKRVELFTYEALTEFYSNSLGKDYKAGDIIMAPKSIGSVWVQSKLAKIITNNKTTTP